MPKGRLNAPPTQSDGVWFRHRGNDVWSTLDRRVDTSTGGMLHSTFKESSKTKPLPPPAPYCEKDQKNFKLKNTFSSHDNRNSFQDHGVYFGNGQDTRTLGKNLTKPSDRHHFTNKDYLKHDGRTTVNYSYDSNYAVSYQGDQNTKKPVHRRFPRIHPQGEPGPKKLDTTITDIYQPPAVPYNTSLQVLASSQEPFLKHNPWKFSYHGSPKCYPPFDKVDRQNPYPVWMVQGS
ncbi:unnamed protein product [Owenia fusiformis]|uniref:Domain of unknown function with conserved HDNR motif domain-containing protein n=1 Tax=Owenia fusiformis TaxID=6347 RepID=A0A8S4NPW9_OWEFU|nr:unnamed protein product [Owenia fusiformis]